MAGIIAKLKYLGVEIENGYVEIHTVQGGPNDKSNPAFPQGQWTAYLYYYSNISYRKSGIFNNLEISDVNSSQMKTQYVRGSDPYDAFSVMLKQWFPNGELIDDATEEKT